jgi:hypothetical protein
MTINPIAKKLGMKPGMRALIAGAPSGYLKLLEPLPDGVLIASNKTGLYPFVQFFAKSVADATKSAPALLKRAAPGALVWIAYPKKTSGIETDLSRDVLWKAISPTGWRPVAIISIDAVWSALRFRPKKDVKSRK